MSRILIIFPFVLSSIVSLAQPTTIRIDPANAFGGTATQIFDEINYIPLETTEESLFGQIDQLAVTDKYFVILDNTSTNSILIFDKKGKFHAKIEGGNVNIKYDKRINSFNINSDANQIEYRTSGSQNIFYYNFEGLKINEKLSPFLNANTYFHFRDNVAVWYNYDPDIRAPDSVDHEIHLTRNDIIYREYLPYNMKTTNLTVDEIMSMQHDNFYATANDTSALFLKPYDYNVYEITPHTFTPKFTFVFPLKNTLPKGFSIDSQYNGKRFQTFQNNKDLVYSIGYTYLLGDNLFFKLADWGGLMNKDSYVYNLKSGKLICINHIVPDASNYFLPIAGPFEFGNSNFLTADSNFLYTSYSSLTMFQAKESTANKNPAYPPVIEKYFKTESRKSNPVIVQFKPKENL